MNNLRMYIMEMLLTIPEEILLLTIEESGEPMVYNKKAMNIILSNALVMELLFDHKIILDEEENIMVTDNDTPLNPYVDKFYQAVKETHTLFPVDYWTLKIISNQGRLRNALYESLKNKNVIEEKSKDILGLVYSRKYPVVDTEMYADARARVKSIVIDQTEPQIRDMFILSLLYHGNMLELIFSEEEIEKYDGRIISLLENDFVGSAIDTEFKRETLFIIFDRMKVLFGSGNPREELEAYTQEIKEKFGITNDKDLPEWLCPGTEQYYKTLEYVDLEGTGYVLYNKQRGLYEALQYVNNRRLN